MLLLKISSGLADRPLGFNPKCLFDDYDADSRFHSSVARTPPREKASGAGSHASTTLIGRVFRKIRSPSLSVKETDQERFSMMSNLNLVLLDHICDWYVDGSDPWEIRRSVGDIGLSERHHI